MRCFKSIFVLIVMSLPLVACQTVVQQSLPQICSLATTAHNAIVASGYGSEKDKRIEQAAWDSLQPLCINPSEQTAESVLVTAALAYAQITAVLKRAPTAAK